MSDGSSLGEFLRSIRRASNFRDINPLLRATGLQDGDTDAEASAADETSGDGGANERTPLVRDSSNGHGHDTETGKPHLRSKLEDQASGRVEEMNRQREETREKQNEDEREPLMTKTVKRSDGTEAEVIVGQSTLPQTIFNSSNGQSSRYTIEDALLNGCNIVLIGVGMLSLPLGVRYAGWIFGPSNHLLRDRERSTSLT